MDIQVYSGVEKFRSSLSEVACKKPVVKNFETFIGKQPWWSSVSRKVGLSLSKKIVLFASLIAL